MASIEKKSINSPDDTRTFEKGKMDLVNIGGGAVGLATFQPGWRWSDHVKPIAKTEWCQAPHFGYSLSGRAKVKLSSGEEYDINPGDVFQIPPGHDGWVVGDEPWVTLDWAGAANYAKG
jgi:quercetin dioxygenase-like cupin family protein